MNYVEYKKLYGINESVAKHAMLLHRQSCWTYSLSVMGRDSDERDKDILSDRLIALVMHYFNYDNDYHYNKS